MPEVRGRGAPVRLWKRPRRHVWELEEQESRWGKRQRSRYPVWVCRACGARAAWWGVLAAPRAFTETECPGRRETVPAPVPAREVTPAP